MHPLETLINEEIAMIKRSPQYTIYYDISMVVHTPYGDVKALYVSDFSLERDYINNFSDILTISSVFGVGTINHQIMPYAKNLEATVTLKPLKSTPMYFESTSVSTQQYRYKAMLYNTNQNIITSNSIADGDINMSNIQDVAGIQFQLINPVQEKIRVASFGGTIRDTKPMDAIQLLLTKYSKVDGVDTTHAVTGVNIVKGYNDKVRDHMIIPHLTPVIRIPKIIEEICGGIYPGGMEYYLQKNLWYVWSPYDTASYEMAPYSLTVINVPANKLPQIEKSFRVSPTQLIVLSTGKVHYTRLSDKTQANESHGVRFVDASKIFEGVGKVTDNKLTIDASKNINEVQAKDSASDNPNNHITESQVRITTNYYKEYAKIAKRKGAILQFTWENSVDMFIRPGMPVRFIYMNGTTPNQTYGTVIALESSYTSIRPGMIQQQFGNRSMVTLFVDDTVLNTTLK